MLTYTTVTNPQYFSENNLEIHLTVKFDHLPEEVPYNAMASTTDPTGIHLYNRAIAGDFGPIAPYVHPVITTQQALRCVQQMIDAKAQEYGFDNMFSATTYLGYPNQFQTIALKLATWRSNVWVAAEAIMAEITAGTRSAPTSPAELTALLAELPAFVE